MKGPFVIPVLTEKFITYDRNYELKARLLNETTYVPQVAVGIRDLVGTGVWGSEYLVASKKFGNFDVTAGMGWGRLAGNGDFNNPMIHLSDSFDSRDGLSGSGWRSFSGYVL